MLGELVINKGPMHQRDRTHRFKVDLGQANKQTLRNAFNKFSACMINDPKVWVQHGTIDWDKEAAYGAPRFKLHEGVHGERDKQNCWSWICSINCCCIFRQC